MNAVFHPWRIRELRDRSDGIPESGREDTIFRRAGPFSGGQSLPAAALKLELTESSIMTDPMAAVALLSQIKSLGIGLAIDDFGTGYSSLSYLQRFPVDTLKIDRSFTSAIGSGGKEESMIVRAIMPLAHNLGLDVVAEGVETSEQVVLLRELHCKYAQGFYFSRPINAEHAQKLLSPSGLAALALKFKRTVEANMESVVGCPSPESSFQIDLPKASRASRAARP